MKLEWKKEYEFGIREIDEQHKKFVDGLSRLIDAIDEQKVKEEMAGILQEIGEYADYHFFTEEKYFDQFNYEGAEEHKQKHQEFRDKFKDILNKYEKDEMAMSFELVEFLENWLFDHLLNLDKKYVECFKNNGL